MSDIAKIEDAYLRGRNRFAKWKEEREKRFNQPLADSMTNALARVLVETVDQIPPEVQTELDRLSPGAMDQLMESANIGMTGGRNANILPASEE